LRPSASERVNLHRVTVDLDTAFSIKNAAGETETFVIEEDDSLRIIDEAIPPSHLFAAAAMGLKEGEKFTTQHGEKWEIVSVKHKYIYSLHTKMEHFERLFPESRGLQRFRFDSADGEKSLEPLLQSIKERHDASERVLDLYSDSSLPLEIFTEGLGSDVIEAWYSLAQTRRKFKVCHGAAQERQVAMKCIKENNRAGCVVDALTLHIIRVLGIDKAITAVCGEIAATESTIETFRLRREQVLSYGGQPFMTLFWRDGQYFREEVTKERLEQTLDIIDRELNWIQQNVKVLPAESVKPVSDEVKRIRDEIAYWFLDPLLAAQGANQLLLCEDQSYRQFGVTEFNVKASWLQPALMLAFEQGAISHRKYYEAICDLVEAGHIFTSINAHILFYALRERESSFKTIADTLFGANAELASHLDVMMTFLSHIWIREHPSLSEKRATSILLRRLCFGEWTSNFSGANPNTILSSLEHNFTNRYFNKYLSGWRVGHIVTWSGNQSQENKAIKNAQNTET